MAKRHIPNKLFQPADMRPNCSVCNRFTPYLFKGVRFCAAHHPDPGPHIASHSSEALRA